ncbi:MAG: hypothetical protein KU28_01720 [Sulfurovum sp. PC08-66]|nr:MAG: hypothetical protein KU28_01720 [Sulfurovum sp. PC08-66]KIM12654.1 MAG: hypothetical protein KU37_01825 [Sulfuricurvum sp. PC08-66]
MRYTSAMRWRTLKKQTKHHSPQKTSPDVRYAGFWSRLLAFVVDIFMIGIPISLLIAAIFGYDTLKETSTLALLEGQRPATPPDPTSAIVQMVLALLVYVGMWWRMGGQTPGKKLAGIAVVDARSFGGASLIQLVVRFFAYFLSFVSLIGFLLPLLLPNKQALHDIFARTVVIYRED